MIPGLDHLTAELATVKPAHWQGTVTSINGASLCLSGLSRHAAIGDTALVTSQLGGEVRVEIVALDDGVAVALPDAMPTGLRIGDPAKLLGPLEIAPDESWLGRLIDPQGASIDGSPVLRGSQSRRLKSPPPGPGDRKGLGPRLETGMAIFNTVLPIARGQRIGLFAGSGVGKSTLLGKLVHGIEADVAVVAMVGERGRELREFTQRVLGPIGMKKSVVVSATSDQSALTRRRCALTAMTIAEHFRDKGRHVLLVADSLTRLAEAHREVALAGGESAALRGFPPSTASLLTEYCERAGPGKVGTGDITAIFSVLVAGSDMDEPVADILRGVLDGHVVLDRAIAERGRFPAIDLSGSVSRALPDVATETENQTIAAARRALGTYERNETMILSGLYSMGHDPDVDHALAVWPRLDAFISESEHAGIANSFKRLEACLRTAEKEAGEDGAES